MEKKTDWQKSVDSFDDSPNAYWKHYILLGKEFKERKHLKPIVDSLNACHTITKESLRRHTITTILKSCIDDLIMYFKDGEEPEEIKECSKAEFMNGEQI